MSHFCTVIVSHILTCRSRRFLVSSFRLCHVDVMAGGRGAAKLAQLRGDAASNGREWLGSALQDVNRKDVRELAQAAGLCVRKDGTDTWLSVGELRAALLEHLAPQRSAAPEEFAVFFYCFVFRFFNSRKVWPH